ncbi:MAG: OB-fold nucleic acid binding domain-containing protein [Euryarchaeota archaeon]|jgi:replication factor A1|uniref:OB-fold nucleic acid binding domain-containing protein n=1 Tax=Methanobacterium sp. MZD130B TaxID=3394378 RepID=UPI001753D018|nr:OB-fold nucleic acid binding domain-containing protein [Euryarchaeota archaeon]HHT18805.1 replication protein A [Methanobacterium sp.]
MREISQEIKDEYEKIKDKISFEEFLDKMEEYKKENADVSFIDDISIAHMVVGDYITEKIETLEETKEFWKIKDLETGKQHLNLIGRVMNLSNVKKFTSKKGREGKLANLILADDTGQIRVVFWTENIKLLDKFEEGDIIKINDVEVKQGFREDEAHMNIRSSLEKQDPQDFSDFPAYDDKITPLKDIKGDMEVNVVARIIRIPRIRSFDRNGRDGKVASLELQDESGTMQFTLWNKDTALIDDLDLKEGNAIKIMGAQSRVRNGEVSLSHSWIGRIEKGDFDVPEYQENILKLGDAHEMRNVTLLGLVSKVYDTITFERDDGSTGNVKSLELEDDTGAIRVTLWNEDTETEIKKGDIMKIIGGNIEFDDYSGTNYRVNTNWNSKIIINPTLDNKLKDILSEVGKYIKPIKISDLNNIEDEGEEVDIVGRVVNLYEPNEFQRDDGTVGMVRTAEIADETGMVRVSMWDNKAEYPLKEGDTIKIENARTRLGDYQVDLSVGRTSRIMKPSKEESEKLPSLKDVESMIYQEKKIKDLVEGDRDVIIIGRVLSLAEPTQFTKSDGSAGIVRSMEIADDSGMVRVSLWDDQANSPLKEGEAVKIENPRVNLRNDRIEISVGRTTLITKAKEDDPIPTLEEIQEKLYPTKKIDQIDRNDQNIKVNGEVVDIRGNKILFEMCPNCNKRVNWVEDAYMCDICGEKIEKPNMLMIIGLVLEDDTGTISMTFFRKSAEEILGMTTLEAEEIIATTGDEGSLEEKVGDLVGRQITAIADANFDEYNEEVRLNAKKLINIQL